MSSKALGKGLIYMNIYVSLHKECYYGWKQVMQEAGLVALSRGEEDEGDTILALPLASCAIVDRALRLGVL